MTPKSYTSTIGFGATIITLFAIIGITAFIKYKDYLGIYLGNEIYKLSYQFLLIIVLGGAVSLLFSIYLKTREERIKQKEKDEAKKNEEKTLQRKFHDDFIQSYNSVKKIRRFLRARARLQKNEGVKGCIVVNTKRYDEQMQALTILQLQFEFFMEEVKSNPSLFAGVQKIDKFYSNLDSIQSYLNKLVDEYEACFKLFPDLSFIDDVITIPIEKLPKLAEFIGKYNEANDLIGKFKIPAREVAATLLDLLTFEKMNI